MSPRLSPEVPLPLPPDFDNVDAYVESLLNLITSSWFLQTLCGGVHILDFYTRSPDLYTTILPQIWRDWFKIADIMDILDLLMREDLDQFDHHTEAAQTWRQYPHPPADLIEYIKTVRRHLLGRYFETPSSPPSMKPSIARHIAIGMKTKKVHEVDHFARYIDNLSAKISAARGQSITHLIDFGSGQNYLGRALAAAPYSKHVVAVESKPHNIEGAKDMDVKARLVERPKVIRNKKEYRALLGKGRQLKEKKRQEDASLSSCDAIDVERKIISSACDNGLPQLASASNLGPLKQVDLNKGTTVCDGDDCVATSADEPVLKSCKNLQMYTDGQGSVQYVEHIIKDGDLAPVIDQIRDVTGVQAGAGEKATLLQQVNASDEEIPKPSAVNGVVISLHSCGNLVHHGLRSLLLNSAISAVAMVGCCYNLVTERLGPPTYKLPTLRSKHPRLMSTSTACDPHGFPMSERLTNYPLPQLQSTLSEEADEVPRGVRLNITARMMAVQAPFNWGCADSELFFSRHFYRALLQRIFLDRGVVSPPLNSCHDDDEAPNSNGFSASGHTSKVNWTPPDGAGPGLSSDGTSTPLTIGTLRKFAYKDFMSYVRAAVAKLTAPNSFCAVDPDFIAGKMEGLTDDEIRDYEERYAEKKHELSVMWSLMAFSAGVVEAVVVVDRWLWLQEQDEVETAWVEPVFDYALSPRNLVIVGIKK